MAIWHTRTNYIINTRARTLALARLRRVGHHGPCVPTPQDMHGVPHRCGESLATAPLSRGGHVRVVRPPALSKTVWPSGLRRWLQAPVRKGVGSNPTAVTCTRARHCEPLLCNRLLCRTVPCCVVRCRALVCRVKAVPCHTVPWRTVPCVRVCVGVCSAPVSLPKDTLPDTGQPERRNPRTPCGTRTRNLRIRSLTPCPLGQGGKYVQ